MTVPQISDLPTPPSRADSPATFTSRADALLGSLPGFVAGVNDLAAFVNDRAADAEEAAKKSASVVRTYATKADLDADLSAPDGLNAIVNRDTDSTLNGWYYKSGDPDTGNWVWLPDQPVASSRFEKSIFDHEAPQSSIIPIAATRSGQMPIFLEDGKFDAAALADSLLAKIRAGLSLDEALESILANAKGYSDQELGRRVAANTLGADFLPLAINKAGQVPVFLENGKFGAAAVADSLLAKIQAGLPLSAPIASRLPVCTDGRSLWKWRAKAGGYDLNWGINQLKLGFMGDSWTEVTVMSRTFRDLLERKYARSGDGWQSVRNALHQDGITVEYSAEWTLVDGADTASLPYGCGLDGYNVYTSSAVATFALAGVQATDYKIFYRQTAGTFRYRIDGGAWTTVTGTGSGGLGIVSITGLSDAVHTLDIDTTGNTSVVSLYGFYTTRANVAGLEINKLGNTGLRSGMIQNYKQYIPGPIAHIDLDILIVILGTNDYRNADSPVSTYIDTLKYIADAWRAAVPDIGIVFVAPPDTNGVAVEPLASYRDALYQFCIATGYEFYNAHDMQGTWAQMNALGHFGDDLHLSNPGVNTLAISFINKFDLWGPYV